MSSDIAGVFLRSEQESKGFEEKAGAIGETSVSSQDETEREYTISCTLDHGPWTFTRIMSCDHAIPVHRGHGIPASTARTVYNMMDHSLKWDHIQSWAATSGITGAITVTFPFTNHNARTSILFGTIDRNDIL